MKAAEVLFAVALLLGFAYLVEWCVDEVRARLGIFKLINRKD